MTQERTAALAALKDAEATVAAAREKMAELQLAFDKQRDVIDAAIRAANEAQVHADSFLPPVVILSRSRHRDAIRQNGVILRRTDKTVTVKCLGNKDDSALQFRPNKYRPDVWSEYPAPKGYSSTWRELEFPAASGHSPA